VPDGMSNEANTRGLTPEVGFLTNFKHSQNGYKSIRIKQTQYPIKTAERILNKDASPENFLGDPSGKLIAVGAEYLLHDDILTLADELALSFDDSLEELKVFDVAPVRFNAVAEVLHHFVAQLAA